MIFYDNLFTKFCVVDNWQTLNVFFFFCLWSLKVFCIHKLQTAGNNDKQKIRSCLCLFFGFLGGGFFAPAKKSRLF